MRAAAMLHHVRFLVLLSCAQALAAQPSEIRRVEKAIKKNPSAKLYSELGGLHGRSGDMEGARTSFEKAAELDPSFHGNHMNLGMVYEHLGHYEEASRSLETALSLQPKSDRLLRMLGHVYKQLDRPDEAAKKFEAALNINKNDPMAHYRLAMLKTDMKTIKRKQAQGTARIETKKQLREGIQHLKKAISIQPDMSEAFVYLGHLQMQLDKLRDAEKSFRQGLELNPTVAEAWAGYGDTLKWQGKADEAADVFVEAESYGIFPSRWQRTKEEFDPHLPRQAFYSTPEMLQRYPCLDELVSRLEAHWSDITHDYRTLHSKRRLFAPEDEGLQSRLNDWISLEFLTLVGNNASCHHANRTCSVLRGIDRSIAPSADGTDSDGHMIDGLKVVQARFSHLEAGGKIRPHCGSSNTRLRVHLALEAPQEGKARIWVNGSAYEYTAGKAVVFDDSFEHQVHNKGNSPRVALLMSIAHPSLTSCDLIRGKTTHTEL